MGVTKERREQICKERLGLICENNKNEKFEIIEYNGYDDILIQFLDEHQCTKHTNWTNICSGKVRNPHHNREGTCGINNQQCNMKIIRYYSNSDIIVEFQDEWKAQVHTRWDHFISGSVKNPYYPTVYGRGITGNKYITYENGKNTKEYHAWYNLFIRCYDNELHNKGKNRAYINCEISSEWNLYENFYDWIHNQNNYNKWLNSNDWDIDKDILQKHNKIYGGDKCVLVPKLVNELFLRNEWNRGKYPIGVTYRPSLNTYISRCENPLTKKREYLGDFKSPEQAFMAYKARKEDIIKQVANQEYARKNITYDCYNAMINYKVDITD